MNKNKLDQLVEETINCMDGAERATPAPYLLTRINARMGREQVSVWERISVFLSRPGIALAAVSLLIIINLFIYTSGSSTNDNNSIQNLQASSEEYSVYNSTTLYDLENVQP